MNTTKTAARIAAATVLSATTLTGALALATPAHAATTSTAAISFCTTPNTNVSLSRWIGNQAFSYKLGTSGPTGCNTFRGVATGVAYVVTRTAVAGSCTLGGVVVTDYISPYAMAPRAGTVANVGTLGYWKSQRVC